MPVVLPFAVAVLLATLLRPIAARLERRGVRPGRRRDHRRARRGLGARAALITLILPPFIARLTDLGSSLQEGVERVAYEVGDSFFGMDRAAVDRTLAERRATACASARAGRRWPGITSLAGALASVVLVVFLSFFLVKDGRRMWTWLLELVPERRRDRVDELRRAQLDVADRLHARRRLRGHRRRGADRRRAADRRRPARAAADRAHLARRVLPDHRRDRRGRRGGARRARRPAARPRR